MSRDERQNPLLSSMRSRGSRLSAISQTFSRFSSRARDASERETKHCLDRGDDGDGSVEVIERSHLVDSDSDDDSHDGSKVADRFVNLEVRPRRATGRVAQPTCAFLPGSGIDGMVVQGAITSSRQRSMSASSYDSSVPGEGEGLCQPNPPLGFSPTMLVLPALLPLSPLKAMSIMAKSPSPLQAVRTVCAAKVPQWQASDTASASPSVPNAEPLLGASLSARTASHAAGAVIGTRDPATSLTLAHMASRPLLYLDNLALEMRSFLIDGADNNRRPAGQLDTISANTVLQWLERLITARASVEQMVEVAAEVALHAHRAEQNDPVGFSSSYPMAAAHGRRRSIEGFWLRTPTRSLWPQHQRHVGDPYESSLPIELSYDSRFDDLAATSASRTPSDGETDMEVPLSFQPRPRARPCTPHPKQRVPPGSSDWSGDEKSECTIADD